MNINIMVEGNKLIVTNRNTQVCYECIIKSRRDFWRALKYILREILE